MKKPKNRIMPSIKKYQLNPILSDERGLFFEVLNNIQISHVIVTTFKKNAVRGNQYRNKMDQYFFLTSGKLKLITKNPNMSDGKNVTEMIQGTMVFIPKGIAFVAKAIEESILLELSPQHFDPKNPDINKYDIDV